MREFEANDGTRWEAYAADEIVAHGKPGAALAFRRLGEFQDEGLRSTLTFNSQEAAAFALRTMSDKELRRRLALARTAAGEVAR